MSRLEFIAKQAELERYYKEQLEKKRNNCWDNRSQSSQQ